MFSFQIYSVGLRRELGMDDETIEALFPRLDDLLEINGMLFLVPQPKMKASISSLFQCWPTADLLIVTS